MMTIKAKLFNPVNLVLKRPVSMTDIKFYVEASIPKDTEAIVEINEEVLNGTPVIKGSRIPVYFVLDYLKNGYTVNEIAQTFPSIGEDRIRKLLANISQMFEVEIEDFGG